MSPSTTLPGWMQAVSEVLPFTHGIEAARRIADGEGLGAVSGLLAAEALVGLVYTALGYAFIRGAERASRRYATLERS